MIRIFKASLQFLAFSLFFLGMAAFASTARAAGPAMPRAAADRPLVVAGATVFTGSVEGGSPAPPIADAVVVVEDGRILAVGPRDEIDLPAAAEVVDAAGRFLVPGLIDMHAHLAMGPVSFSIEDGAPAATLTPDPEVALHSLRTLLAHGVTTIRDPGGDTATTVAIRDAVHRGELVGPRVFTAGSVIDSAPFAGLSVAVADAEAVRREVRAQAEAGVDFIKLYASLTPEMMAAGIDEAHRHGLTTIAHTLATTWTQAARDGLDALVHILPGSPALLPEEERAAYAEEMASTRFMYSWFERVDLDGPEVTEMLDALAEHEVTVDPTLVMWEAMIRGDDPAVTDAPELALVAPSLLENWRSGFRMDVGWTAEDYRRARAAFPKALELARRLHRRGIRLTAGTDANNPWVVPGPSLHRELELLAEAGIPNSHVLRIATAHGAAVLGRLDELGTVEKGKRADLVLLVADPLTDISATRSIEWVMKDGVLHSPAELTTGR